MGSHAGCHLLAVGVKQSVSPVPASPRDQAIICPLVLKLGVKRSNMKMIVFRSRKRISTRMRLAMRPPRSDHYHATVCVAS